MKKIIYIIIVLFAVYLAWAPWLDNNMLHDRILREKAHIDGTKDKNGNIICDYNVMWAPFGRWVASCEGGYYTLFGKTIY